MKYELKITDDAGNVHLYDVSDSLLDWQKIEDEVSDMYKLPVAVNIKGLKFKFYAEFLSGASWMRKRILGNNR